MGLNELLKRLFGNEIEPTAVLTCKKCGKRYSIGKDAQVVTTSDVRRMMSSVALPPSAPLRSAALVGHSKDYQQLHRSAETILTLYRLSAAGEPQYWWCANCGDRDRYLLFDQHCAANDAVSASLAVKKDVPVDPASVFFIWLIIPRQAEPGSNELGVATFQRFLDLNPNSGRELIEKELFRSVWTKWLFVDDLEVTDVFVNGRADAHAKLYSFIEVIRDQVRAESNITLVDFSILVQPFSAEAYGALQGAFGWVVTCYRSSLPKVAFVSTT